jgi:murein DD-endopeptidase MepM/ murein hydrolase activator NlpD
MLKFFNGLCDNRQSLDMNFPKVIKKLSFLVLTTLLISGCQSSLFSQHQPAGAGVYHSVQPGQTLYRIAQTYEINVQRLIRINKIRDTTNVPVGTRLWIPGAFRVRYVPPAQKPKQRIVQKKHRKQKSKQKKRPPVKNFLQWPVKGTLTSTFGKRGSRNHDGIDIGTPKGTPIYAAAGGQVVFSDWGPTGYGLMVIIKHKNHLTTVYAHNSKNWVRKNAWVKRGQKIASVGTTGRSTGPHLHFEVRNDTHPRNPLKYLPSKR